MKAMVYTEYRPPEVLQLTEVEIPAPKEGDVLIKVYGTTVTSGDYRARNLDLSARIMGLIFGFNFGLTGPKNTILGSELAGEIESVGKDVSLFKEGDQVFGSTGEGFGAYAEYICLPEDGELAIKPANMTFEEAAAVPVGAHTVLFFLRDKANIQSGQKVLIYGASGGVGTAAVQLAQYFGAEVSGVCSTRNLDMLRSLGADQVIDYTQEDFTQNGQRYDLIIDTVGNPSIYMRFYKRSLSPKGICVIIAGSFFLQLFLGPWMSITGSNKIGTFMTVTKKEDLISIKELLEASKIVPVIDKCYPLSEVPEAILYLEEGHARGKVVILV